MKKLLLLAILPFALLCACSKGGATYSGPTDCGTVQFSKNRRSVTIRGKKLKLVEKKNVIFTDPSSNPDAYFDFNTADAEFMLNYRVYNVRVMQIEFFEPVNMRKYENIYVDFYQKEDDITPIYSVGGALGAGYWQVNGQARMISIGNINNETEGGAYMHIRFTGSQNVVQSVVSVIFSDLIVTTK